MNQRSVLITGCSSGIGKAAAEFLKNKGWYVFATARKVKDIESLKTAGFESCALDLDNSNSIENAVNYVLSKTSGTLDALVNNAGYGLTSAIEDLTRDELRAQFESNVFGLQELTNKLIPVFRKQGHGRIVNISSIVGKFALPYVGAYSASKFALEALSDALRLELADTNISVSIIEPGPIKSKFSENAYKIFENLKNKDKSPHSKVYKIIQQQRQDKAKQGNKYPAKDVVKRIQHAIESKRPKARYLVTPQSYFLYTCIKILPGFFINFVAKQHLKKYKREDV